MEILTAREHILRFPELYIGSTHPSTEKEWTLDVTTRQATQLELTITPALEYFVASLFDNDLSTVVDCTIDDRTIYVRCGDLNVPIMFTDGKWLPTTWFTDLSYRDGCNIPLVFTDFLHVTCVNPKQGLRYVLECTDNLKKINSPHTYQCLDKEGWISLFCHPSFARFGVSEFSEDFRKRIAFILATHSFLKQIPTTFNGVSFNYRSVEQYSSLFAGTDTPRLIHETDNVRLCLLYIPNQRFIISFINGVETKKHGAHVDAVLTGLLGITGVKNRISVIVACNVSNPQFTGADKERFTEPVPWFQIPVTPMLWFLGAIHT